MEFFRAALYDCIVDDDNLSFENINHYRHMVEMNIIDDDDLQKLMSIAFEWLDDPIHKPFHVYMLWQACRALLMNGFTPVKVNQVYAIFYQHPREFAKCFSDIEDIYSLMMVYGTNNDVAESCVWDTYILKVSRLGNKLLQYAENKNIKFSNAKYNPDCVPYGLTKMIASADGTDMDPRCAPRGRNYEEMMFKYGVSIDLNNKRDREKRDLPSVDAATELLMKLSVEITVKYNNGEIHKSVVTDTVTASNYDSFDRDAKAELGYMIRTNM